MILIFPTDTVYGIGCKIDDLKAIDKIYEIKHRSKDKPLACLCANLEQIDSIAKINDEAIKLINKYLPGGLTLILESKEHIKKLIGYKTIGVRIPNCKVALDILLENGPMLTTSVNDSGSVALNEYDIIKEKYEKLVDKIYEGSEASSNVASTVVKIVDNEITILREGNIKLEDIKKTLEE